VTVRIIREGKVPDVTRVGNCRNCKTLFECAPEDCKVTRGRQLDDDDLWIDCPVCNRSVMTYPKASQPWR